MREILQSVFGQIKPICHQCMINMFNHLHNGSVLNWMKGKPAGNPTFDGTMPWFPVDFPYTTPLKMVTFPFLVIKSACWLIVFWLSPHVRRLISDPFIKATIVKLNQPRHDLGSKLFRGLVKSQPIQ